MSCLSKAEDDNVFQEALGGNCSAPLHIMIERFKAQMMFYHFVLI